MSPSPHTFHHSPLLPSLHTILHPEYSSPQHHLTPSLNLHLLPLPQTFTTTPPLTIASHPHSTPHHHLTHLTLTITSHPHHPSYPHQNSWFLFLLAIHKELFPEADGAIVISQESSLCACSQHRQARPKGEAKNTNNPISQ